MATNRHRFRAVVYLIIAIANVISTWLLVPHLGVIGAALCSCLSYLAGQGIAINLYYYKVIHLDIPNFWKQIVKMSAIPAVMAVLAILLQNVVSFDNWFIFFVSVFVYTCIYGIAMYLFAMNEYEKEIVLVPLKKILRLMHK